MANISPFALHHDDAYQRWRGSKFSQYPSVVEDLRIEVGDMADLTEAEKNQIHRTLSLTNMVVYASLRHRTSRDAVQALGEQFGLTHLDRHLCVDEDGISSLQVVEGGRQAADYIPYTNKPINWHTDGYYNTPEHLIRGMVLHCVCDAASGGDNALLDHEVVYSLMRDENREYIQALMHPQAMTIPANVVEGQEIRPEQSGPVFSLDGRGNLHMRYTARKRSIVWRDDPVTQEAVAFLEQLLASDSPYIFRYRLQPGEGLLCNNVLHNRSGFTDNPDIGKSRQFFRARYYDRIAATDWSSSER